MLALLYESYAVADFKMGDEAETQRLQEEHTHHYLRWTFVGAFAVAIVGLIGVGLTFLD
jgi:hypothetical protein